MIEALPPIVNDREAAPTPFATVLATPFAEHSAPLLVGSTIDATSIYIEERNFMPLTRRGSSTGHPVTWPFLLS
jgi:hypothetical protein